MADYEFALKDALDRASETFQASEEFAPKSSRDRSHISVVPIESWSYAPQALLPCRFIGYAEGNLGLGQTFRDDVVAAVEAEVRVAIYPFRVAIETRLIGPFLPHRYDTENNYPINIITVAPDQIDNVFNSIPDNVVAGSYNILKDMGIT